MFSSSCRFNFYKGVTFKRNTSHITQHYMPENIDLKTSFAVAN